MRGARRAREELLKDIEGTRKEGSRMYHSFRDKLASRKEVAFASLTSARALRALSGKRSRSLKGVVLFSAVAVAGSALVRFARRFAARRP